MENLDSTVIATSLPAIARDLHEDPISLKLALTSYLISLAIFIPASGWAADRFGARTIFRAAILVFTFWLYLVRHGLDLAGTCRRPHRPRPWRRDDGSGRAAFAVALRRTLGARGRTILSDGPSAAWADLRATAWRFHHHLFSLALDFLDQRADRRRRHRSLPPYTSRTSRRRHRSRSTLPAFSSAVSGSPLCCSGLAASGAASCPGKPRLFWRAWALSP